MIESVKTKTLKLFACNALHERNPRGIATSYSLKVINKEGCFTCSP